MRETMRDKCTKLRNELDIALTLIGKKLGMAIKIDGGMKFYPDEGMITLKLQAMAPNTSGEIESHEAKEFKRYAESYGLKPDDLGKAFNFRGDDYTIVGAKPRSTRFPILGKRHDGKIFKFVPSDIAQQLHPVTVTARPIGNRSREAILEDLRRVDSELSPENLHADGERPISQVRILKSKLDAERRKLVAELGHEPTDHELYPEIYR